MARKIKRYGCRPDIKDHRDLLFHESVHYKAIQLPPVADLADKLPACWDQGDEGSCTGHGSSAAVAFIHPGFMPARQMPYYDGRVIEGDTDQDNGAQIRDVVSGLAKYGVCSEDLLPYGVTKFAVAPTPDQYTAALPYKISNYYRIIDLNDLKNCIAQGFPVIMGFTVYSNFESPVVASSGILHMPGFFDRNMGGHCVLAMGYDDNKGMAHIRNSWGTEWGQQGNFWMDYKYFHKLVSDMWTVRQ